MAAHFAGGALSGFLKFARSRRGVVVLLAVVVLLLFFVRPGVDGLRLRIAGSISRALGRPVEISSVSFRFLPRPGFDLENFVVYDDPWFSAEPVVRAQQVTASLRMLSLLRGRLEISRLSLSEPSLNLVRNSEGRWNLGSLVERAAKVPVAPTGKAKSEPRPGFPYIEASNGRINFKLGQEKKAYALTDADFSLWQDSENAWGMRLQARPVRTDSNFTDTGTIRAEGTWQRAATLAETPLHFDLRWESAQLGQFTKLATGTDRGWRGTILWLVSLNGTPADLEVQTSASIEDFRRTDIVGGDALRLAAQCSGHYDATSQSLTQIDCQAPAGTGGLRISGAVAGPGNDRSYDLLFAANDVPLAVVVSLLRHAKRNIPDDIVSAGKLNAQVTLRSGPGQPPLWQGGGAIEGGRMISRSVNGDLILAHVPFQIAEGNISHKKVAEMAGSRMEIGPVRVSLGGPNPVSVNGSIARGGYDFRIQGDTRVGRLLQAGHLLGMPTPQPAADGAARIELEIAGAWSGFQPASITGKAQLSGVRAEIAGVNAPLEIATADVILQPDNLIAQNITANLGSSSWHGSLSRPRHCASAEECTVRFDFQSKEVVAATLLKLFVPATQQQPWYRFLSSPQGGSAFLANLHAEGKLSAGKVTIQQVAATQVSARIVWNKRVLQLSELRGNLLGGTHLGEWSADFTGPAPQYAGTGGLKNVSLRQIAQAMRDDWASGTVSAGYEVNASGASADEFYSSVHGALDADAQDATLLHLVLPPGSGPLYARRFAGKLLFRSGRLDVREGKLETGAGIYQVSGTALKGRGLNLQMSKSATHGFNITGSLAAPRVTPAQASETRAALRTQ
jgi:hypothetical protein